MGVEFSIWIEDCLNSDLPKNVFVFKSACSGIEHLLLVFCNVLATKIPHRIHWIDLEVRPVILVCGQLYYVGAARSTMQCGGSQMVF